MTTTVPIRSHGVDVSDYQGSNVNYVGNKFVLIKLTEGTSYKNPKASAQIANAKTHGIMPMGYFYAHHSGNSAVARSEANYACNVAAAVGLPKGSYIADDWEQGSGNNTGGPTSANTTAVLEAMRVIKARGYKPLIYSGAYLMRNKLNSDSFVKQYGSCLWVAAYPLGELASTSPNFNYFPSMNGVAIWQFTDNWKGKNVDGNINVVELKTNAVSGSKSVSYSTQKFLHPVVKWNIPRVAVVYSSNGAALYDSEKLSKKIGTKKQGTAWAVLGEKNGAIKVGKNQWFDGRAVYTMSNPIATNDHKFANVKVVTHAANIMYEPKWNGKLAYTVKVGKQLEIVGRKGYMLELKNKYKGKTVWISGNRTYIIL